MPSVRNCLSNKFGNFFINSLFLLLEPEDRFNILKEISLNLNFILRSKIAIIVTCKILNDLKFPFELDLILKSLVLNLDSILVNKNGLLLLESFEGLKAEFFRPLVLILIYKIPNIVINQTSYYLMNKIALKTTDNHIRSMIVQKIVIEFDELVYHQFGSIFIQNILEYYPISLTKYIYKRFKNNIIQMISNPFSVYLIVKGFKYEKYLLIDYFEKEILDRNMLYLFIENVPEADMILQSISKNLTNFIYRDLCKRQTYKNVMENPNIHKDNLDLKTFKDFR